MLTSLCNIHSLSTLQHACYVYSLRGHWNLAFGRSGCRTLSQSKSGDLGRMSHRFYRPVGLEPRQLVLTCGERLPWSPCYARLEDGVSSRGRVGNGKGSAHSRTEEGECGDECDQHSKTLACLGAEEEARCECDVDRSYSKPLRDAESVGSA